MAGKILEVKEQLEKSLHDSSKPWTSALANIEAKTGVNRLYIFIGSIAVVGLWLVFGFAAQLVCNFVGFIYPAYASTHALETTKKEDDTKWLTYWVVFALFSLVEFFADIIVGWFPLYWLIKCIFLVWLMIPTEFNGSSFMYKKLVRPYFLKHHSSIDSAMNNIKQNAAKLMEAKDK